VLIDEKLQLGLKDWFDKNNPYALQDAMAVMLEAARKGYWQADQAVLRELAESYAANIAKNGMSGHITGGGNRQLDGFVKGLLNEDTQRSQELLARYSEQIQAQVGSESFSSPLAIRDQAIPDPAVPDPAKEQAVSQPIELVADAAPAATVPPAEATVATIESDVATATGDAVESQQARAAQNIIDGEFIRGRQLAPVPSQNPTQTDEGSAAQEVSNQVTLPTRALSVVVVITLILLSGFALRRKY
jgi:cobalamin biosynthesis Mg chelatase CobN